MRIFTLVTIISVIVIQSLLAQEWTGAWDTSYGELRLVQVSDNVYGDYNDGNGTIEGKLDKNNRILTGYFYNAKAKKEGDFTFIRWNGNSFKGSWNWYNSTEKAEWNGTKSSSAFPSLKYYGKFNEPVWTGGWDTNFGPITLRQNGSSVTGDYTNADGWIRASYHPPTRTLSGIFFNRRANKKGQFEFFLEKNDKYFSGKWSWLNNESGGKWNGKRVIDSPINNNSKEDCIPLNYTTLKVIPENSKYLISDGTSRMLVIDNKNEAEQILRIIKAYQINAQCYVGRPNPSFTYCLSYNKAPTASNLRGEDCINFNRFNLGIKYINNNWTITDGSHLLFAFKNRKDEAEQALKIINKYKFNQVCYIGRPNSSFQYLTIK